MSDKVTINLHIPVGYESTGEYRLPLIGEYYLGKNGVHYTDVPDNLKRFILKQTFAYYSHKVQLPEFEDYTLTGAYRCVKFNEMYDGIDGPSVWRRQDPSHTEFIILEKKSSPPLSSYKMGDILNVLSQNIDVMVNDNNRMTIIKSFNLGKWPLGLTISIKDYNHWKVEERSS